jgi:RNA polymerase sigma-70 factor, ECF subfamily
MTTDRFRNELLRALPKLRGFALSYCGTPADADDAIQVTCERALSRWAQWSGQGSLDRWLIKILVNAWRDECRARRVRAGPDLDSIEEPAGGGSDAADALFLDQVRAEILRLPDNQREVLLLVAGEGLSYKDTAQLLEIPVGTVMSRLARARQALIGALRVNDA